MQKVIDHLKAERGGACIKHDLACSKIDQAKRALKEAEQERAEWNDMVAQLDQALEKLKNEP